ISPAARGKIRSKQPSDVLTEAAALAQAGCHEIILTGIETAAYGRDSGGAFNLAALMKQLNDVPGIERIGLGSLEPTLMRERFLSEIAPLKAVLPHFHISLQSGSSSVLKRMRRPYNADQAMDFIRAVREYFPQAMLTADVIVGFPGETEAEFEETMAFCREAQFLHLHIFPYSIRRGTEAAGMPDQVPECVKKQRAADLAKQQAEIKRALLEKYVESHREKPVYVLIEEEKKGYLVGHSEHYVEIRLGADAGQIGQIVPVTLRETNGDVCFGE
ncbi:MAG: MiaB/RimO family radical SAM methylthiotransferase, partial [Clostridia bacterium]|nr:MiaB/RimO family radical SAM methylthiotransferase [Clostridia bacterium]